MREGRVRPQAELGWRLVMETLFQTDDLFYFISQANPGGSDSSL